MNAITRFVRDDSGQDMLEYALLTALIALAAVVAVKAAGVQVSAIFDTGGLPAISIVVIVVNSSSVWTFGLVSSK
jgi:Flp pilus assembly pilin Flp